MKVRIGSRDSRLAVIQSEMVIKAIEEYNEKHGITPKTIIKEIKNTLDIGKKVSEKTLLKGDIPHEIDRLTSMMKIASSQLDFERAIELRNKIALLKKRLNKKEGIE